MDGIRRALVTTALTMLTLATVGALVQPAAWAATEHRIRWSPEQVTTIREHIAQGDTLCDALSLAAGTATGVATAGATVATGAVIGTAVGGVGFLCGGNNPRMREAVEEGHFRKCGVDVYFTDGTKSYDTDYRYVVCP